MAALHIDRLSVNTLSVGTLTANNVVSQSATVGAGTASAVLLTLPLDRGKTYVIEVSLVGAPQQLGAPAAVAAHHLVVAATCSAGGAAAVVSVATVAGAEATSIGYPVVAAAGAAVEVRIAAAYGCTQGGSRWSGRASLLAV
jgi:hypothetical protein